MLRDSYSIIKQIYKHLASKSPQKGVFAITQEVLVDHFAKKANLVDKNLRLADIDRAFIAATFSKHANQLCPPSSDPPSFFDSHKIKLNNSLLNKAIR